MANPNNPPFGSFNLFYFFRIIGLPVLFIVLAVGLLLLFDYLEKKRKRQKSINSEATKDDNTTRIHRWHCTRQKRA